MILLDVYTKNVYYFSKISSSKHIPKVNQICQVPMLPC